MIDFEWIRMPVHMSLHIVAPAVFALAISRFTTLKFGRTFLLLMVGLIIDIDHLLATPVFDPGRCSVGFHPLHTWPATLAYVALLLPRPTRLIAVGLLIHIGLDVSDCAWMSHG